MAENRLVARMPEICGWLDRDRAGPDQYFAVVWENPSKPGVINWTYYFTDDLAFERAGSFPPPGFDRLVLEKKIWAHDALCPESEMAPWETERKFDSCRCAWTWGIIER